MLRRYKEYPATMVAVWEQSIRPSLSDAEVSTVHSLIDHEREGLTYHDYVALFEMGAHFSLYQTIFFAISDEDNTAGKGPLAFQRKYQKNRALAGEGLSFCSDLMGKNMRIGKQDQALTVIATSDADSTTVRGYDLCNDLIGKTDFADYFWLLVKGENPTDSQKMMTTPAWCVNPGAILDHRNGRII